VLVCQVLPADEAPAAVQSGEVERTLGAAKWAIDLPTYDHSGRNSSSNTGVIGRSVLVLLVFLSVFASWIRERLGWLGAWIVVVDFLNGLRVA
jgi:apolipoprotein N-acyltransferase